MSNPEVLQNYKSNSQIIRILSENWFSNEMFCPCCMSYKINTHPNNRKVSDFFCESCRNEFQLKSSKSPFVRKVTDGEYHTMIKAISNDESPNFFFLNYTIEDYSVKDLIMIPKFFVNHSIIEKRKPLSSTARRAGWTGCNILLERLPDYGKISIIDDRNPINPKEVNNKWKKVSFLSKKRPELRGWTSDVLKCIDHMDKKSFSLSEIYRYHDYLKRLHPDNNNIEAKIRQQLQILRDNDILKFRGNGIYEVAR